ncbi:MAG TPA: flippase-like domain-containing protein [Firmicutes bacterium]|nr:flippase-like domain-containing protein [Bacillota bacterium]
MNVKTLANLKKGALAAVLLSFLAIMVILKLTMGPEFMPTLFKINPTYLGAAGALVVAGWGIEALRIRLLVRALGGHLRFMRALKIALIGAFAAAVTPFDTGGEPFQVYMLQDAGITLGESTAVVAIKVLSSALARLVLGTAIPLWLILGKSRWDIPRSMDMVISGGLALYFLALFLGLFFMIRPETATSVARAILKTRLMRRVIPEGRADSILERIHDEVTAFRSALTRFLVSHRTVVIVVSILGLLGWIQLFLIPILLLRGLGVSPPYAGALGIISVFYMVAAYAPTPGASGAAEASFAILFGQIVPIHLIGIFVIAWRFITYHLTLIIGGILVTLGIARRGPPTRGRLTRGDPGKHSSCAPPDRKARRSR